MKAPNWKTCTEEELWKYVASHLAKNGIHTILVGGAVVSVYTDGLYRSGDLDLVLDTVLAKNLPQLMAEIGFKLEVGRHYKHPACSHLFVEFASPPASIGEDSRITPAERKVDGTIIRIYSPTDCVRDRLASYIHFKARDCLDQAVLVAQAHPVDLDKIKKWCRAEGAPTAYEEFVGLVRSN